MAWAAAWDSIGKICFAYKRRIICWGNWKKWFLHALDKYMCRLFLKDCFRFSLGNWTFLQLHHCFLRVLWNLTLSCMKRFEMLIAEVMQHKVSKLSFVLWGGNNWSFENVGFLRKDVYELCAVFSSSMITLSETCSAFLYYLTIRKAVLTQRLSFLRITL